MGNFQFFKLLIGGSLLYNVVLVSATQQCESNMKVKVLVTQSCPALCDPMDCSPPGSSVHGILQARILRWVAMPFSRGSFQTQRLDPGLLHCRWIFYRLSYQGSPRTLEWGASPFSRGSSQPRNRTAVSSTAGRFFTV